MRSRPLPPADRLHTGRSYGSWRDGVSSGRWRRTERRPPRTVQETARNLVGCASLHRTVGRLRTLPWDAETRAPPLRDSTVTGSSTPPYHTPSSEVVGDHGGWLGRRLTTRSQRGHGDLSRVAIAGGE